MKQYLTFAVRTLMVLSMAGCTQTKNDVLGPAPTTTEAVMEEVMGSRQGRLADSWAVTGSLPSELAQRRYAPTESFLASKAEYVKNERLTLYYFPKRDPLGHIKPGYMMEIPLYTQMHMTMKEEAR